MKASYTSKSKEQKDGILLLIQNKLWKHLVTITDKDHTSDSNFRLGKCDVCLSDMWSTKGSVGSKKGCWMYFGVNRLGQMKV